MSSKSKPSRVESIFFAALKLSDPNERKVFLAEKCGEDRDLRARVERFLHAHEGIDEFMDGAAVDVVATQDPPIGERPGMVIDRYKLLQQIGEGGFGVVFMAEQLEPVRRKVALKIIKPGMDTKEVIARFEAERQALALMDHPHIARVFDGGATESGRPYFVMELVRGIPITDFCDMNNLTPCERLELFIDVCLAVQHAHQKGIIHRDLKPNNVLVTLDDRGPEVRVIDFGVAKAIGQELTEKTLFTRFEQMIGTPIYMSPEQTEMRTRDVDTRSDIYSLGVLLYELLTGTTPLDRNRLQQAAYGEICRIIKEEDPPKPSNRISTLRETLTAVSEHRKTEPKKLAAIVKGDLDWIVMRALEKDRSQRYDAAKDFADDIRHYLNDEPIDARAPSTFYRARKLVRRYRFAAFAATLVLLTLVFATGFSTWMAVREWRAHSRAQVAQAEAVRQKKEADRQREIADRNTEIAEQAQRSALIFATQEVQGTKFSDDGAQNKVLHQALSASASTPTHWTLWQTLAATFRSQGEYAKAKEAYRQMRRIAYASPRSNVSWRHVAAGSYGSVLRDLRDYESAERILREFLDFAESEKIVENDPTYLRRKFFYAEALYLQGKFKAANSCWNQITLELTRALEAGETIWGTPYDRICLARNVSLTTHEKTQLGENLRLLDQLEESTRHNALAPRLWDEIAAETHERLGNTREAIEHHRICLKSMASDEYDVRQRVQNKLAVLLTQTGQHDEAEQVLQNAVDEVAANLGEDHLYADYLRVDLAELLGSRSEYDRAEPLLIVTQERILSCDHAPVTEKRRVISLLASLYEAVDKPDEASLWRNQLSD